MGKILQSKVDDWRAPEKLELLRGWARDFNNREICEKMNITSKTFWEWRNNYPEIDAALREGREIVDYRVENALLKSALGFKTKEVKVTIGSPDKKGNREVRREVTEKEFAPNVTAIMCWLNNRKPKDWKRNRDLYENDNKDNNITVNIVTHNDNSEQELEENDNWETSVNSTDNNRKTVKNKAKTKKK